MTASVKVSVVKTDHRESGVRSAIELLGDELPDLSHKRVILKPNFNSADPFPASTHNDTLSSVVQSLKRQGAAAVIVAERSGIAWNSHEVAEDKGIVPLLKTLGAEYIILDDLSAEDWVHIPLDGGHWKRGIEMPRMVLEADAVVEICCLKTHAYGGHFTLSLKNAVGFVSRKASADGYEYMKELHSSPRQRSMIAEINSTFSADLLVMDGLSAFVDGGPTAGTTVHPGLVLASTDRIALDAVGVAILRTFETTPDVLNGAIFEQEQIERAVHLGLGIASPSQIELVAASDQESQDWMEQIQMKLSD
jgi:uncharacterized protein (DUF362 family)